MFGSPLCLREDKNGLLCLILNSLNRLSHFCVLPAGSHHSLESALGLERQSGPTSDMIAGGGEAHSSPRNASMGAVIGTVEVTKGRRDGHPPLSLSESEQVCLLADTGEHWPGRGGDPGTRGGTRRRRATVHGRRWGIPVPPTPGGCMAHLFCILEKGRTSRSLPTLVIAATRCSEEQNLELKCRWQQVLLKRWAPRLERGSQSP